MNDRAATALVVMPPGAERDLVVQLLEDLGVLVRVVAEPYEAMVHLLERPVDLLVLSLEGLRRSDGRFITHVRPLGPAVRVLLLVPAGRREFAAGFLRAGADAELPLPFLVDAFKSVVRGLLRKEAADPLTGLPNRAAHQTAAVRDIARAAREGSSLGLGLLDLDDFGVANRELGYKRADRLLVEVSDRMRSLVRIPDFLARWGGEEFVVLLTGLPADGEQARSGGCGAIKRIRLAVADTPVRIDARTERPVTLCGGLALFPHDVGNSGSGDALMRPTRRECMDLESALFGVANQRLKDAKKTNGKNSQRCRD